MDELKLKQLTLLAEAGDFYSMHNLAVQLDSGEYIPKDVKMAAFWYRIAADHGYSFSQCNLGDMYQTGIGVEQSAGNAIYWYTQAAMQGEPVAYMSLGLRFADGNAVIRDNDTALFWLTLALYFLPAGQNMNDTIDKQNEVIGRMNERAISRAIARANMFEPLKQTKTIMEDKITTASPQDKNDKLKH